jgi:uncharacterized membrane protein YoaK (UPF0700 family)
MLKKLIEIANRPKRPPTRRALLQALAFQALLLLFILVIVTFWPEKSPATGSLVILCLGHTLMLWFEALEHHLGTTDEQSEK